MIGNINNNIKTYEIDVIKYGHYQHPIYKHIHVHEFYMTLENVYKQLFIGNAEKQPVFYEDSQVKHPSLKSEISANQHELLRHSSETGEWCDIDFGHLGIFMSVDSMVQDIHVPVKQHEELGCPEQRWKASIDITKNQGVINGNTSLQNLGLHINHYCIPNAKPLPKGLFRFYVFTGVQQKELLLLAEKLNSTADIFDYTLDNLADKLDLLKCSFDGRLDVRTGKELTKNPKLLQASSIGEFEVFPTQKYPENAFVFIQNDPEKQASALDPIKLIQAAHTFNLEKYPGTDEHPTSVVARKKSSYDYYRSDLPNAIRIIAPIAGDANFIKQWIMARSYFWAMSLEDKKSKLKEHKYRIGTDNNGRGKYVSDTTRININRLFLPKPKKGFSFEGKKKNYGFIDEKDPIVQHYNVLRIKEMKQFQELVESIALVMTGSLRVFLELNENGIVSYAEGYSRNKIIEMLESGLGHEMLCILLQETDMSVESVEFRNSEKEIITGKSISTVTKTDLPWDKTYGVAETWLKEFDERSKYWSNLLNFKSDKKNIKSAVKVSKTLTSSN